MNPLQQRFLDFARNDTVGEFLHLCKRSNVQQMFELSVPYIVLCDEDEKVIFSKDSGWADFYGKYPGSPGVIEISRVGFNTQLTQALFVIGIQSGWRSGHRSFVLAEKVKDKWKFKNTVLGWMS